MTLVLDASAAIGWLLPDEPNVTIPLTTDSILYVPAVFAYEIAHAIQKAVRSDRLSVDQARDALRVLAGFPIRIAPSSPTAATVFDFAARYEVNAYDAAYLALSLEQGLPLATTDARLAEAARRAGIAVIGSPP